jgi:hypothetical protein
VWNSVVLSALCGAVKKPLWSENKQIINVNKIVFLNSYFLNTDNKITMLKIV